MKILSGKAILLVILIQLVAFFVAATRILSHVLGS